MFSSETKSMVEKILASMTLDRAHLYIEPVTPGEQGKWEELGPEYIRYAIVYRSEGFLQGPWHHGYPSAALIKHMQVHWKRGALVQAKIDFAKRIVHYGVEEQKRWQQFIDEKKNKKPSWPMPRRRW